MSKTVRVIVMNCDEDAAPELRAHLLSVDGVKIVAEVDEPGLLAHALDQFPAEVLLVHLDPNPQGMMEVVAPLVESRKGQLTTIGMTEDRNAELVVRAMRAGMREFLWKPFPPEQLHELLQRIAAQLAPNARQVGRLVPIMGVSGGAGATTLAVNLACELVLLDTWRDAPPNATKPRVAVVDLDFRYGQVATFLDAQATYTIAELCDTAEQLELRLLERVMVKHPSGVHILAHPHDMEQAARISAASCAAALAALLEHYDFVIVDGPVRFDQTARAVFDLTDIYLIVMQLLVPSVRNCDRVIQDLQRQGYNLDRLRLVCNRHGREAGTLEQADVETTLNRKLDFIMPEDWKTSSTSVNVGAALCEHAPKSKLRLAYRQIALAVAGGCEKVADEAADTHKKGLLSFFGGKS